MLLTWAFLSIRINIVLFVATSISHYLMETYLPMDQKLFLCLFYFTPIVISAQQGGSYQFDDVIPLNDFFEQSMQKSQQFDLDLAVLLRECSAKSIGNNSAAGILHTSTVFKKNQNRPKCITTIRQLKKIDLQKTMMHEISVLEDVVVDALKHLFVGSKLNKKELKHAFRVMKNSEKGTERLRYFCYLRRIIAALQRGLRSDQIDKELVVFADLKDKQPFINSFKQIKYFFASKIQMIDSTAVVKYVLLLTMCIFLW